jgi:hypothetical protein
MTESVMNALLILVAAMDLKTQLSVHLTLSLSLLRQSAVLPIPNALMGLQ